MFNDFHGKINYFYGFTRGYLTIHVFKETSETLRPPSPVSRGNSSEALLIWRAAHQLLEQQMGLLKP